MCMIQFNNKRQDLIKKRECIKKIIDNKVEYDKFIKLNKPFITPLVIKSEIPLNLFTCWHSKVLPPYLNFLYESVKKENPEFNHYCFSNEECAEFIKNNFSKEVFDAYNNLVPDSYKSDLWRYCVLYINGGIYYDIKFSCVNNFKFIYLTEKELFIRDRPQNYILTGLLVAQPKNEIIKKCIDKILYNVRNKIYGNDVLCPTGPGLLGSFFTLEEYNKNPNYFGETNISDTFNQQYIVYNNKIIIMSDNMLYRKCQTTNQTKPHYGELWRNKQIYQNI